MERREEIEMTSASSYSKVAPWCRVALMVATLLVVGCFGGGRGSPSGSTSGQVTLTMTDAPSTSFTAFAANSVIAVPFHGLIVRWNVPGTATPLVSGSTVFPATVDLSSVPAGGAVVENPGEVVTLTSNLKLTLWSTGYSTLRGSFVIHQGGVLTVYDGDHYESWFSDLSARLSRGGKVVRLSAIGKYYMSEDTPSVPAFAVREMAVFIP